MCVGILTKYTSLNRIQKNFWTLLLLLAVIVMLLFYYWNLTKNCRLVSCVVHCLVVIFCVDLLIYRASFNFWFRSHWPGPRSRNIFMDPLSVPERILRTLMALFRVKSEMKFAKWVVESLQKLPTSGRGSLGISKISPLMLNIIEKKNNLNALLSTSTKLLIIIHQACN